MRSAAMIPGPKKNTKYNAVAAAQAARNVM